MQTDELTRALEVPTHIATRTEGTVSGSVCKLCTFLYVKGHILYTFIAMLSVSKQDLPAQKHVAPPVCCRTTCAAMPVTAIGARPLQKLQRNRLVQ